MGKKTRQQRRAAKRRAAAHNRAVGRIEDQARQAIDEIVTAAIDKRIDPTDVAAQIMAFFDGDRITPSLPALVAEKASATRARALADALIELDEDGVSGLTFAAAVAGDDTEAADLLEQAAERLALVARLHRARGRARPVLRVHDSAPRPG